MDFTMVGPGIVLGLGCLGSSIGCAIAGSAVHGVMTHVDEGHGKYIGLSALPSSQSIYAFVLMILMAGKLRDGVLPPLSAIGIGLSIGLALMVCSIYQGKVVATGVQAAAKQPAIFGKCAAAAGIVETFAVFAFVFTLLII
jgi:V/A-type H+/Na+-transporting ATPase subunit K